MSIYKSVIILRVQFCFQILPECLSIEIEKHFTFHADIPGLSEQALDTLILFFILKGAYNHRVMLSM